MNNKKKIHKKGHIEILFIKYEDINIYLYKRDHYQYNSIVILKYL